MSIATAPRNILKIKLRQTVNLGFRAIKILYPSKFKSQEQLNKISVYPPILSEDVLGDILNRLSWYLPYEKLEIDIPISFRLKKDLSLLPISDSQGYFMEKSLNFNFYKQRDIEKQLKNSDIILLHDSKHLANPTLWKHLVKVEITDPHFFSIVESGTYSNLYFRTLSEEEKHNYRELSRKNFKNLIKSVSYRDAYVFATGPSLDKAINFSFPEDSFKIVCNTIVKNKELLSYINPQLLVFADPVFHFGPSNYAIEFREQMIDAVRQYNCYCMVPENKLPLLLMHYPELEDKIIGMPTAPLENFNFPDPDNFYVMGTGNILTLFMLPVASAIARKIYIIGADGRQKREKYFWKHSSNAQFSDDLMQTAFDTHPSFFRDRIYTDYYESHVKLLTNMIKYGESLGKKYFSLTPSYIPALKQRYKL